MVVVWPGYRCTRYSGVIYICLLRCSCCTLSAWGQKLLAVCRRVGMYARATMNMPTMLLLLLLLRLEVREKLVYMYTPATVHLHMAHCYSYSWVENAWVRHKRYRAKFGVISGCTRGRRFVEYPPAVMCIVSQFRSVDAPRASASQNCSVLHVQPLPVLSLRIRSVVYVYV